MIGTEYQNNNQTIKQHAETFQTQKAQVNKYIRTRQQTHQSKKSHQLTNTSKKKSSKKVTPGLPLAAACGKVGHRNDPGQGRGSVAPWPPPWRSWQSGTAARLPL